MEQNTVTVRGELRGLPEPSHENHGRRFFRFFVDVPRLSGTVDTLPVIAEERILSEIIPDAGNMLLITGQIRSYNERDGEARHLRVFIFASCILADDGEPMNEVVLEGVLCREPSYRRTPLGREICDVMLAIPRNYNRADYLPCILWGRTAQTVSRCHTRDTLRICGRLQSRTYVKQLPEGSVTRTAYEISALTGSIISPEE